MVAQLLKCNILDAQVLLYAPNLVGYVRLGLLGAALLTGTARPGLTVWLFIINFALDGVDGYLARALNQVLALHHGKCHVAGKGMHACFITYPFTANWHMRTVGLCRPLPLAPSWMSPLTAAAAPRCMPGRSKARLPPCP